MNDMSLVIQPRSDQLNADDFIAGPKTYTIEGVAITPGAEQPVSINLVGEPRMWRPCKSMSRVLVAGWGPDAKVYAGRSVTLYRDPKVKWGGLEIGGIRISHMSHIDRDMLLQLTATKGKRAPHVITPLVVEDRPTEKADPARKWATAYVARVNSADDMDALNAFANGQANRLGQLASKRPELHSECVVALDNRRAGLSRTSPPDDATATAADDWDDAPDAMDGADMEQGQ